MALLLIMVASMAHDVHCGALFCAVKYSFVDERCEKCCNDNGLISSSTSDGGCSCIASIAKQFKESYPAVTNEETKLEMLARTQVAN